MASETDTRHVDDPASECVLLSDADGEIRWASPSTADVFDRDPDEIRRTETVRTLLGPDAPDPETVGPEPVARSLTVTDGDGTAHELSVTAESDSGPAVTVYRCRRLDDQLRVEDVLARVDDAVVAFDTDWRYTYLNPAAERLLDHDAEALLGENVWDVFPEARGTRIQTTLERSLATGESATIEWYWEPTDQYLDVRCFPSDSGVSLYFTNVTERKEREDALRRERDLTDQLLGVSPMGIAVHTPDRRFVRLNERAETILGVDREDLLGEVLDESMWVAYGPDGDPLPDEAFPLNVVLRTGEPTFGTEMSIRRADGRHIWMSVSAAPLVDERGDIERVVVGFEDITDRREREADLRQERELVEQLLRASPVGIAVHTPDGRFVKLNERAEDIIGLDREELLGEALDEPVWEATGPDGEPFPDDSFPFNVVLRTGEPTFGTEMSVRRRDGTRLWISVNAAPLRNADGDIERVVVAFEDVTERKQYEQELRENEQQFRAVFDGTLDALVLADDDGDYLEVNDAACELYGLDEADLVGRNVADFAPPEYDVAAAWDAFVEQGSLRGEFPLVGPDGEVKTTDFVATANVTPGRHLSALRDITDRKARERQLATQHEELTRLNRINELIREVHRTIVGATDRETIREAVCAELVDSERYPLAIASRLTGSDEVRIDHVDGLPADATARLRSAGAPSLEAAIRETSTENTLTVRSDLRTDTPRADPLRSLATTHDIGAVANIPLAYEGVVYGVLTVGAHDETAFGEREQSVFLELGQLLGTAIDAIQTKKLLYDTAYQELKLTASARDAPLVELHDRLGEALTVDGVVPVESGRYLLYVVADDAAPADAEAADDATTAAVEAAVDGIDGIEAARVVDAEPRPLLELRLGESTAISALLDAGGRLRGGTIDDSIGEFVVDVPLDTDVRAYLDRVERRDVDLGLLSKREVERVGSGTWDLSSTQLTDRQRSVLEASYRSGYFEWPRRRTTGEELADALDISSSTLHQHLRVATGKVLEAYLQGHDGDTS